MTAAITGDLLSASSLLTAVLGLLYSIWYAEIQTAGEITVPRRREDRGDATARVQHALRLRAWPLLAASVGLAGILTPPTIDLVTATARSALVGHFRYDAIGACFVAVYLLILVLAVAALRAVRRLHRLRSQLLGPSVTGPPAA